LLSGGCISSLPEYAACNLSGSKTGAGTRGSKSVRNKRRAGYLGDRSPRRGLSGDVGLCCGAATHEACWGGPQPQGEWGQGGLLRLLAFRYLCEAKAGLDIVELLARHLDIRIDEVVQRAGRVALSQLQVSPDSELNPIGRGGAEVEISTVLMLPDFRSRCGYPMRASHTSRRAPACLFEKHPGRQFQSPTGTSYGFVH
jgi:hypothetical protein